MERVAVRGCSSSGTSTFSRALSEATGLTVISLDALFWRPFWVGSDSEDFAARLRPELDRDRWIVEGNNTGDGFGEERLRRDIRRFLAGFGSGSAAGLPEARQSR